MTVISFKIPNEKVSEVSTYVTKAGGSKVTLKPRHDFEDKDDEVTHESFFGENIKRLMKAFKK